jgi:hypothetical protein
LSRYIESCYHSMPAWLPADGFWFVCGGRRFPGPRSRSGWSAPYQSLAVVNFGPPGEQHYCPHTQKGCGHSLFDQRLVLFHIDMGNAVRWLAARRNCHIFDLAKSQPKMGFAPSPALPRGLRPSSWQWRRALLAFCLKPICAQRRIYTAFPSLRRAGYGATVCALRRG